ncbi:mitochondrial ribosomal subunit S27-domain-containing protein [Apiosordaria backusii]|uniref:Small ribosomal subunit protein mS33 n=1 Tax=Apiosordaria backusii TaxID=314023 RepID=A0AA40ELU8_9PEZI|nr:mitochondrial ribosomal subunit S27-domain-containing protein [Apiosordaria backusii]
MSVPRARLLQLMEARCKLFETTFNPEGIRAGNKILRQRLKGPALAGYYPRRLWTMQEFQAEFRDLHLMVDDEKELDRFEHVSLLKARGKGAPKKKNSGPDFKKGKK